MILISDVKESAAAQFRITPDELVRRTRQPHYVLARQFGIAAARQLSDAHETNPLSLAQISQAFGLCDHTMAIHSIQRVEKLLETDARAKKRLESIKARAKAIAKERERSIEPLNLVMSDSQKDSAHEVRC